MGKEFTYKMNIDAEISAILSKLKTLGNSFEGLEGKGLSNINHTLESIGKTIDAVKLKAAAPIKTEGALGSIEKDGIKINQIYEGLGESLKNFANLSQKQKIDLLPKDSADRLNKAYKAIEQSSKNIQEAYQRTKELTKADQDLADANNKVLEIEKQKKALSGAKGGVQKNQNAIASILKEVDAYEQLNKQIKELEAKRDASRKEETKASYQSSIDELKATEIYTKGLQYSAEEIANMKAKYDETVVTIKKYNDAIATQTKTLTTAKAEQKALKENLETIKQEMDNSIPNAKKLKAAYDDLKNQAKELHIDLSGLGDEANVENFNELTQRCQQLIDQGLVPVDDALSKAKQEYESLGISVNTLNSQIETSTEEFKQQSEAAGEVSGLISRIKQFTGLTGAAILMRRALQNAVSTIKDLDEQMTKMAVVTNLKVSDYWKQLPEHTKRANELGMAIKDVYEAETLYYQQGLKTVEVTKLSTSTLKMARIAGLSAEEATNKMTAALRGFNMEINETNADRIADVYSKLAAITASNVDEISSAMTKTASIASNAGMEFETTAAFLSQIIETTRESAETAGTALKTVIARFQELKKSPDEIGEIDGEIIDANKIETALRSVGVALRDTRGQFRELDDVFIELSKKWDTLDMNTQRYIATIAAGSRQQSRFVAMMSNYKRTMELVNAANNAAGASNEQFKKTMDSLENKLAQLKNAWDTFTQGLANNELIKVAIDALTKILTAINKITEGWDSWSGAALKIGLVTAALIISSKVLKSFELHFMKARKESGIFTATIEGLKGSVVDSAQWLSNLRKKIANLNNTVHNASLKINKFTTEHTWLKTTLKQTTQAQKEYLTSLNDESISEAQASVIKTNLVKVANEQFIALGLTNKETEHATDMVLAGIPADQAAMLAKKGLTVEIIKEKLALDSLNGELSETQLNTLGMTGFDGIGGLTKGFKNLSQILGKSKEQWTASFNNLKGSFTELGQSIGKFFSNFGASIGYFAAALAVLIITIVGIVHIVKAFHKNSPEGQLEAAAEKAATLAKSADEAGQKFKNLTDKFNQLKTASENIKTLTKGTQEWRQAAQDINKEYFELLEIYPQLAKLQTKMDNGYIEFADQQAADQMMKEAELANFQMQNAATMAKIEQLKKQQDVTFSTLSDKAKVGDTSGAGWAAWGAITGTAVAGGAGAGALTGAGIGSLGAGIMAAPGTAIGAGIGAAAGLVGGTITAFATGAIEDAKKTAEMNQKTLTDQFAKELTTRANMSQSEIEKWLQENDEAYKNNIDQTQRVAAELVTVQEELRKYGQNLQQVEATNEAYITTMKANIMSTIDTNSYTNTEVQQMENLLTTDLMGSIETQIDAQIATAINDKSFNDLNTTLGRDLKTGLFCLTFQNDLDSL